MSKWNHGTNLGCSHWSAKTLVPILHFWTMLTSLDMLQNTFHPSLIASHDLIDPSCKYFDVANTFPVEKSRAWIVKRFLCFITSSLIVYYCVLFIKTITNMHNDTVCRLVSQGQNLSPLEWKTWSKSFF